MATKLSSQLDRPLLVPSPDAMKGVFDSLELIALKIQEVIDPTTLEFTEAAL